MRAEIRDLRPPAWVRNALAGRAAVKLETRLVLERARAEHATLRSLANAARTMHGQPELLAPRTMQQGRGPQVVINIPPGADRDPNEAPAAVPPPAETSSGT